MSSSLEKSSWESGVAQPKSTRKFTRPEGLVEQDLLGGVGEPVLAPDDMGDPIADIVHGVTEDVERFSDGANNDKVFSHFDLWKTTVFSMKDFRVHINEELRSFR